MPNWQVTGLTRSLISQHVLSARNPTSISAVTASMRLAARSAARRSGVATSLMLRRFVVRSCTLQENK
jgi:hypothetical protein